MCFVATQYSATALVRVVVAHTVEAIKADCLLQSYQLQWKQTRAGWYADIPGGGYVSIAALDTNMVHCIGMG